MKRKSQYQKTKDAVRTLYYYGFISQFERDSFLMRMKKADDERKRQKARRQSKNKGSND